MLGELASGIAGMAGSIWSTHKNNKLQYKMFQEANAFNAAEAEKQRNWEADMANTAHQREVADLQNAGLNPVLSAGGNGAATPSGSSASSAGTPSTMPLLNDPMAFANLMNQTSLTEAQVKNLETESDLKSKQAGKTKAETGLIDLETQIQTIKAPLETALLQTQDRKQKTEIAQALKDMQKIDQEISESKEKITYLQSQGKLTEAQAEVAKQEQKIKAWEGRHPIISRILPGTGGAAGALAGTMIGGPIGGVIGSQLGNIGKRKIGF